jgi:protein SCO1/2
MFQKIFLKISFIIVVCLFFGCKPKVEQLPLPYYNTPDFTPQFLNNKDDIEAKINHKIKNFSFINQNGENITQQNIENKIHVANFIFTSCGSICLVMTKHMKLVDSAFYNAKDLVILSYSVTPWIDDVERLKKYTARNKINGDNWFFLTGSKAKIYALARESYFAEENLGFTKDSSDFLHTEHMLLIDKNKRIRGIYNGTLQLETEQLIKDIKTLQKEINPHH